MALQSKELLRRHDLRVSAEVALALAQGRPFSHGNWQENEPDLFLQYPDEQCDVKTLNSRGTVAVRAKQLDEFTRDYSQLFIALWSARGRLALPPSELLERAVPNGDSLVHKIPDRTPFYQFDLNADSTSFENPFRDVRLDAPETPDLTLQLTLDGRAVERTNGARLGKAQREVLNVLSFTPLTSTEVGVLLHVLHGHCPSYQREDKYGHAYGGGACCRKAVDLGSDIMGTMKRQGRVHKIGSYWSLPSEVWV